jgi:hypothetical protein
VYDVEAWSDFGVAVAGVVAAFIGCTMNAWVLLIEIHR